MKWSSLKYLTKQGILSLRANSLMTIAGIGVLTICLMITGAAALFTLNVDSLIDYLGSQNETVVYLDPYASDGEMGDVYDEILAVEGVAAAQFVSKADVLSTYSGYLEEYAEVWESFETDNPFKANYRVTVEDLTRIEEITAQLAIIDNVVSVSAPIEMSSIFVDVQNVVTVTGYILVAVLAAVSVVVISNTIRLTVYARRKEINIMKYVGATNAFIRWPFFVEGVFVGIVSAIIALVVVLGSYAAITLKAAELLTGFWQTLLGTSLVPLDGIWYWFVIAGLCGGAFIGGFGSVVSIRKHLDV